MFKNLKDYLEQIDHYLVVKEGKNEILSEIKSHILEKTEKEFGQITEDSLGKVITHYGRPKKVAEKYLDGYQIISPTFKKYLFLYTGILFMLHLSLSILSVLNGWMNFMFFPFFFIPDMGFIELMSYVPMAFVYDFGLVSLFLYVVTQSKRDIKLPWPRLKVSAPSAPEKKRTKPKVIDLILMLIGFSLVVFAYLRYHNLFFVSLDLKSPASLLNPEASKWYSLFLITFIGCEIIGYSFRFFTQSDWVPLVINAFYLLLIWIILNNPIDNAYVGIQGSNLNLVNSLIKVFGGFALALLAVLAAIDFTKSLIRIIRKKMAA
ncbi:MAG: hypothetical protein JSV96_00550 [Candidatus Aminicenantes bacterium]|nr:MAG: hypothetical protein JSV96_00550 [Candidatus Aminicenantes bacterium]